MEKVKLPSGETLDEFFARMKSEAKELRAARYDQSNPNHRLDCERCGETYRRSSIDDCESCARPVCYQCGHWVTAADGVRHWKCDICVTVEKTAPPPAAT